MEKIKESPEAMAAAVSASGLSEGVIVAAINQQLASDELAIDHGIDFVVGKYLLLNLGVFLLMFAISSISFLFSCVFNLTKNSLALGAGIPVAFLIFKIMAEASTSLEGFKYATLNTLFTPSHIIGDDGTYLPQFAILAALGVVLYMVGVKVFKEKDLPL